MACSLLWRVSLLVSYELVASKTLYVSDKASGSGDGTQGKPFKRISSAASLAQPGDTVLVAGGLYRERVAPANSGQENKPITYMAAPGEDVVITASEVLKWTASKDDGGSFVAQLDDSLFDTIDGTPKGKLYNPFLDPMQSGVGCNALTTGQVHIDGKFLAEIGLADLHKCASNPYKPNGCFSAAADGKTLHARWPKEYKGSMPSSVEVTVRSRVFAPHKRGLQYIVVQGFTIEHAANQWIANFWFPENYHYAQSGALGTRSGYRWTIRNNTIRKAKTIGFDWGIEGGYAGHPVDNEGTNQSDPAVHGEHTVVHNIFEHNAASGVQGYGASGTFAYNIIQDNGGLGCGGAENAAFKSHGYKGTFEGNVFRRNNVGLALWFDESSGPTRFTRNVVLVDQNHDSEAIFIEIGTGPVLVDNNIFVGPGAGSSTGIVAQDASNVVVTHNLVMKFGGAAVDLHGLTGRACDGKICQMAGWWIQANMLVANANKPWLMIHHKKEGSGRELITNETAQHNLISGTEPVYPRDAGLDITVGSNQNAAGSGFALEIDRDAMQLSFYGDSVFEKTACATGGPGGDQDFTGAKRSGSRCVPGPLDGLAAGQKKVISLWPTGITPPVPPTPTSLSV